MGLISNQTTLIILGSCLGTSFAFFFQLDRLAYFCIFLGFLVLIFDGVSMLFAIHNQTLRTNELLEEIKSKNAHRN